MPFTTNELKSIDFDCNSSSFRGVDNAEGSNIGGLLASALARISNYDPNYHNDDNARATEVHQILLPLVRRARRENLLEGESPIFPKGYSQTDFALDKQAALNLQEEWLNILEQAQNQLDPYDCKCRKIIGLSNK